MKKISIIIPVYNEERTLGKIIQKLNSVRLPLEKELIIVNDSSTDNTEKIIQQLKKKHKNIKSFKHKTNFGKGAAIRTGLKHVTGDIITIQDGDLEYNPEDFNKLIKPILDCKTKVVYGSRMLGHVTGFNILSHYYGNKFLTFITSLLYRQKITDMETCYKMYTKDVIENINLKSKRFDIEPEVTAKIIKQGHKILELPIDYSCRSFEEGKKINWKDGIKAIYTLFKYRFFN